MTACDKRSNPGMRQVILIIIALYAENVREIKLSSVLKIIVSDKT